MQTLNFNQCQSVSAGALGFDTTHTLDYTIAGATLGGVTGLIYGGVTHQFVGAAVGLFGGAVIGAALLASANLIIENTKYQEKLHVGV